MRGRAFDAAGKAVRLDNGYAGKAYMIMGNLWSSASCSGMTTTTTVRTR